MTGSNHERLPATSIENSARRRRRWKVLYVVRCAWLHLVYKNGSEKEKTGSLLERRTTELVHFIGKDNIVFHASSSVFSRRLKTIFPRKCSAMSFKSQEIKFNLKNWALVTEYLKNSRERRCSLCTHNARNQRQWLYVERFTNPQQQRVGCGTELHQPRCRLTIRLRGASSATGGACTRQSGSWRTKTIPQPCGWFHRKIPFPWNYSQEMLNLARLGNKLADEEPWKRIKDQPERVPTIMHMAQSALHWVPFANLYRTVQMNCSILNVVFHLVGVKSQQHTWSRTIGTTLLLKKIGRSDCLGKLETTKIANEETAIDLPPPAISLKTLANWTFELERFQRRESEKDILQLEVDLGNEVRTIVSA